MLLMAVLVASSCAAGNGSPDERARSSASTPSATPSAGWSIERSQSAGLPATPDVVVCGDSGRYQDLTAQAPGIVAQQGLCVPWFIVVVLTPVEGRAQVRLGDVAIELDLARIAEVGSPSAGSGEFDVAVTPPVYLKPGDAIALDLRGCGLACRDVYVRVPLLPAP